MSAEARSARLRWAVSAVTAVVVTALVVPLFRAPPAPPVRAAVAAKPPVLLTAFGAAGGALNEAAVLFDPTPMFLPTQWNAAQQRLVRRRSGATFEDYGAKFTFAEKDLKLNLPAPVAVPAGPVDALSGDSPGALALGIGRRDEPEAPALAARGAFVEIVAAGSGRRVLAQSLTDARPPGGGAWQPLEFMALVDAAGLVGSLVVTKRSDVDGVDSYFQRYLAQSMRVGQRLAPGLYRICVGP